MHLQSLELFGFKSFADKTVFNFHEGVTAIVGPNGCGKSNLLDAIRWVLGEQSAKSLRGGEMADVIFNGTDSRKPVGYAEVSLTFSDCATELEVDWNEVCVSRRIYRDGNSEYFLNRTACRLRDIQSLFADTGVGRAAYSMMEQGKIDMVLSSRPEDRRAVFEEAAGITKFKTQKREALRKLEATEANLLRVGDIIKEVKRQIGSLQRQAGKARRYQALHIDLRTLDTHHSRKQLEKLEADLAGCRAEIERLNKSETETREKIDNGEAELAQQRLGVDEIDIKIADGRAKLQRLESEIGTHRSHIEFNRQRAAELTELIERSRKDIAVADSKRTQQHKEIEQANTLIETTASLVQAKETELAKITEQISQLRTERTEREAEIGTFRESFSKSENRIEELEDELSGLTIRRETTQENQRDLENSISETNKNRSRVEKEIAAVRAAIEKAQKDVDLLKTAAQLREESLQQHQQSLAEADKGLTEIERALSEKGSRIEILRQLNEEGEGLAQGSQAVLRGLGDPSRIQPALAGALVSKLDVDPKFIAAIEAALGRNQHAIVLDDPALAPEIISTLTQKKLGQAALAVPKLGASSARKHGGLPETSLGWATEKVTAPDALTPLVSQLLHNVAIFADLDLALAARKKQGDFAAATLTGEFISAEGIVFGGSGENVSDSLLERKARISILSAEHSVLSHQRDTLRQTRDDTKRRMETTTQDFEKARAQFETAGREQSVSENRIQFLDRELNDVQGKIDTLRSDNATLGQQLEASDQRIAALEQKLGAERAVYSEKQAQQTAAEAARIELDERDQHAREQLNDIRLALATEQQRHENLLAQRQPMTARETELAETVAARQSEISDFEKRLNAQAGESENAKATIEKQTAHRAELEANVAALADQRTSRLSATNETESSLRNVRNTLNELHDLRSQQQVRESQLQMQVQNLLEHIERRYQLNLREFVIDQPAFEKILRLQIKREEKLEGGAPATPSQTAEGSRELAPPDQSVEKIISDLTRQLDNMGPVNLEAVQEYDELEERFKFLDTQNNDLTNSRRELLEVIAKINSTTRQLFADTFAQVRANFREMFAELFGGGRADLSLMDEGDPLNCGIEISAKPPGKQLQAVSLLSGGERAMTAVALLFAIYMVRPSPFCILDEIDAPLDESNINRFVRMLDRFVGQSQFIIITHNKRTIAKADILYGVTMEERGISKLVGMKLSGPREVPTEPASNGNGHGEVATQRHLSIAGR
ncbi:MAG: chromosome segregation protein SMC [Verrucomicrobiota bacterium]